MDGKRKKTDKPEGATGGAHWIGDMVRWQNSDAVVLAFVCTYFILL